MQRRICYFNLSMYYYVASDVQLRTEYQIIFRRPTLINVLIFANSTEPAEGIHTVLNHMRDPVRNKISEFNLDPRVGKSQTDHTRKKAWRLTLQERSVSTSAEGG